MSGGATVSCMGEVTRAARAAGGRTIGVIPQVLVEIEIADEDSDELIVTADMRERKGQMDARSDAFLVLPGGIGTLEELFEIWTARVLGIHDRPLVILDPWGGSTGRSGTWSAACTTPGSPAPASSTPSPGPPRSARRWPISKPARSPSGRAWRS
ncbi:TIGR00730 family Rossman fold protein [Nonomuraea ferruginea]